MWHSTYPTGNAVLSQSAGRCFAPLQTLQAEIAAITDHRSYVLTEALSGVCLYACRRKSSVW